MTKYSFQTLSTFAGIGILVASTAYFTYDGYTKSITPSNFELAANRLGFNGYKKVNKHISASEHQEALLKQLQMAGYFKSEKLWKDIYCLGVTDPIATFKQMYIAIKKSKADQNDPHKFNAKILRKNLGKGTALDEQDVMDLILYISQNAFGRKIDQERNELVSQEWMNKYKDEYLASAKILRLIDREVPEYTNYDEAWIAGTSRIGLMARIIDYHYILSKYNLQVNGETLVLAGERILWANIDGIIPVVRDKMIEAYKTGVDLDTLNIFLITGDNKMRIEEGKEYMLGLATRYNIKFDPTSPFIQYNTIEECPPGYFPGRVYLKCAAEEKQQLTETLMSQDLITNYLSNGTQSITVIDTLAHQHQRSTTASTAHDAATRFIERIVNGEYGDTKEFIILFETNNPYIERQTIMTRRQVNKVLSDYKLNNKGYIINVEGIGFKCQQDIVIIHSELAALVAEKWKDAVEDQQESISPKRSIENLLFQTRNNAIDVPPQPSIPKVHILGGDLIQDLFDEYLP